MQFTGIDEYWVEFRGRDNAMVAFAAFKADGIHSPEEAVEHAIRDHQRCAEEAADGWRIARVEFEAQSGTHPNDRPTVDATITVYGN